MVSWNLDFTGGRITNGSQDSYLASQAAALKAFGKPVFLRLDWEMNGTWYPEYNEPAVTPASFVASWQYVVNYLRGAGVTNAAFVWCPNVNDPISGTTFTQWYPGDAYVDWTGIDAYPQFSSGTWELTGADGLNSQAAFAQAHNKPMMLAEWAPTTKLVSGALSDTATIDTIFNWAAAYPNTVKAIVYFDYVTQGQDFTLTDHPQAAAEYRKYVDGVARFAATVTGTVAT
jgi:beta-mannanase